MDKAAVKGKAMIKQKHREIFPVFVFVYLWNTVIYFIASSTATATATEAPTIGLLPMPMRPIIST